MTRKTPCVIHHCWNIPAINNTAFISKSTNELKHLHDGSIYLVHLLSSWLQFTDLKPGQQVILAYTLTQVGFGDGVQFSGWHCRKNETLLAEKTGICHQAALNSIQHSKGQFLFISLKTSEHERCNGDKTKSTGLMKIH